MKEPEITNSWIAEFLQTAFPRMPRCDVYLIAEQNALIVSLVFQRVHPVGFHGNAYICLHCRLT